MRSFAVASLLLLLLPHSAAAQKSEHEKRVAAWIHQHRRDGLNRLIPEMTELTEAKTKAKRKDDAEEVQRRIDLVRRKAEFVTGDGLEVRAYRPLANGTQALLGKVKVFQVVDARNVIVDIGEDSFYVTGLSTAGLVDDKTYELREVVQAAGTKQYTTALRSVRTVALLKAVPDDQLPDPKILDEPLPDLTPKAPAKPAPKPAQPEDPEQGAARLLRAAKRYVDNDLAAEAVPVLQELLEKHPKSAVAGDAVALLEKLAKKLTGTKAGKQAEDVLKVYRAK